MKKVILTMGIIFSFFLISCGISKETISNNIEQLTPQYEVETDGHINNIMSELCSDGYRGRVVGTEENIKTSEYIKDFFVSLGVQPFYDDNYFNNTNLRVNGEITEDTNNISAVIKGKNSEKAVFITAHLDHVKGRGGIGLPGAIDNASGVSVMLEIAHKLTEQLGANQLNMDVVFVAFNAEETGLNGSYEFVNNYTNKYKELYNINIDCVGYKEAYNLVMGNNHPESEKLYKAMKDVFNEEGVKYNNELYATRDGVQMGTSDHEVFRMLGYPALVLGDEKILDVVHTKEDNLQNIDYSDLEKISDTISKFIIKFNGEMFN